MTVIVPAHETGVVRVFDVDLGEADAKAFAGAPETIARALGVDTIAADRVEVFPVSNLGELGLRGYLAEGYGIPQEDLAKDSAQLDDLSGYVAVISSGAFGPDGAELRVKSPLRLIGTYAEPRAEVQFGALPSGGARVTLGGPPDEPPPTDVRRGGGKIVALLVLVLAFIALAFLGGNR